MNDEKISFFKLLRLLLKKAKVNDQVKERFMPFLSEGRWELLSIEESEELMDILREASIDLEKEIVEGGDIEQIRDLTAMKEFVNDLFMKAEEKALKEVIAKFGKGENDSDDNQATQKDANWLLDQFVGL